MDLLPRIIYTTELLYYNILSTMFSNTVNYLGTVLEHSVSKELHIYRKNLTFITINAL